MPLVPIVIVAIALSVGSRYTAHAAFSKFMICGAIACALLAAFICIRDLVRPEDSQREAE